MIDRSVTDALRGAKRCALIAHVTPDGDTLGSVLALSLALDKLGVANDLYCEDPVPYVYRLLPGWQRFRVPPSPAPVYPLAVCVDVSDEGRMGACADIFRMAEKTLVLDHHKTNPGFGDANVVLERAATSEIVLEVIDALGVPLDRDIAFNLFVALSTDTGNFSYGNTTGGAMRSAARFIDAGIDIAGITRAVFRVRSPGKTKLIGRAIANMRFEEGGRIAVICLSGEDYAQCGAADEDTEGIIDYARDCEGVEVALLARESQGGVKVSLRSPGIVDVGTLAAALGGGGHYNASGITVPGDMAHAVRIVLDAARKAMGAC